MKLFNAFQFVILFIAWPFILQWLAGATFAGAAALWYAACVAFLVHFGFSIAAAYSLIESEN